MKRILLISLFALVACSSAEKKPITAVPAPPPLPKSLEEAVSLSWRTPDNAKRDQYRHPLETLKFFDVKPEMTVVEIWPSAGWYTEILAPYLATHGTYIAALRPPVNAKLKQWMDDHAAASVRIKILNFNPPKELNPVAANSADRVLTFRNFHNWMQHNQSEAVLKAAFKMLKPGGILGVVEHRALTDKPQDPRATSGYVREDYVIALAKKAGFQLLEKSEINANPADTKDYPDGVWTLPPTLKLGDKDKDRFLRIGESDRMTLKFVKPVKSNRKK